MYILNIRTHTNQIDSETLFYFAFLWRGEEMYNDSKKWYIIVEVDLYFNISFNSWIFLFVLLSFFSLLAVLLTYSTCIVPWHSPQVVSVKSNMVFKWRRISKEASALKTDNTSSSVSLQQPFFCFSLSSLCVTDRCSPNISYKNE